MQEAEIKLLLPFPPSINQAYGTDFKTKRRYKTKVYKDWEKFAERDLWQNKHYKITGNEWLRVEYKFFSKFINNNGTKKKKDVENYIKCLSDFLGNNIEWFDDHKIQELVAKKYNCSQDYVEVLITEL